MTTAGASWAGDARLQRALAHAQRGEVLQAEMLLRDVLNEHPTCLPALAQIAQFAQQRGDLEGALHYLDRALGCAANNPDLRLGHAQLQAELGQVESALAELKSLIKDVPEYGHAGLLLADLLEAQGDALGALRARHQAVTRAQAVGRWLTRDSTEPIWVDTVLRHMATFRSTHRAYLMASFDALRQRHGAADLQRVERALTGYLGEWDATPPDARQRPKFLFFPGLPNGPYHDPYLQPWAPLLQAAWQDMRTEAMVLLAQDRDFESFLGLKPGQSAQGYVGGSNPQAAWDAFFFYRHGLRFDANHLQCPKTSAALDAIELCHVERQAPEVCFSVIRPQTTLIRHYGVTNTRLVMHLPLVVPADCALNIIDAGEHAWREGALMMFDDSFQHEAWNRSDEPRLILLMDCWNPYLTPVEQQAVKLLVEAIGSIENPAES